ncbi:heparinase II/III family protein [Halalkalibacter urbisdiaboli]|uniref:heparinase II/III family protein n=1 Tax=Halalkalibacter urbisdiaboli TaxID=1960589 RepID=UPI000B436C1D|nr:heparinase II/III family protein [Halalkalibacter urbisdiaboli]
MNQNQIRDLLNSSHVEMSSLLFSSKQEQQNWFDRINGNCHYQLMLEEIKSEAQRLIHEPDPELTYSLFKLFEETGSRLEYQHVYFEKRRRLNTFALMTLLEPDNQQYIDALQNTLWSICDEYTWCLPAHLTNKPETLTEHHFSLQKQSSAERTIDLFAAETAFAISEIARLTEHVLDPLIIKRMYEEVYKRVLWPFCYQRFDWETATHNWASVCAGSIGSAALHLIEDTDALSIVLERVLETMEYYLKGFNDDGACLEGYGYWQYGFGYYVYFADLLKKKTEGNIDLFKSEKVHQIALFQQKSFLDKNVTVNFSDAVPKANVFLGLSHYLHRVYPDIDIPEKEIRAKYTEDHCSRWAPALRNLLWFDARLKGKPWGDATYYLPNAQWFVSRYSSSCGRYAFASKGGHNAEPHNHNDLGHFMLYGNHEVFLMDLGSGLYTSKSFGPERYSIFCNGSQGHSVPIINHVYQQEGEASQATIQETIIGENEEIFQLNLSKAYDLDCLKRLSRRFRWKKADKPTLIVEDSYSFVEQPTSIVERFITPIHTIEEDEDSILLIGEQTLRIVFEREQLELKQSKMEFLNHFGEKEAFIVLDFSVKNLKKECDVKIVFQFE